MNMIRPLQKNGNSKSLILTKTMCAHLGIQDDRVQVIMKEDGSILLRKPLSSAEAEDISHRKLKKVFEQIVETVED